MFSQTQNTQRCALCNGTVFYKEAGFYYCNQCQTQNEDIREEVVETQFDATTRVKKTRIKADKSEKTGDVVGWTSWELYNFVLIGITNELIEIGANPDIKLTILQLWTMYLSKLEVAFTSKTKKCIPKMARRYHKKDAEIIYGKIQQKKKKHRKQTSRTTSASSLVSTGVSDASSARRELSKSKRRLVALEYDKYLQSQVSSETDGLSSLNQSLYSLKSSISGASSNTRTKLRFNKRAKLESKKVKVLSTKVPRLNRKTYQTKHVTNQYSSGPDIITPLKLWSIAYLALRINNQNIYLSDMLRFGRESHLSYYKLDHLVPPEVSLTKSDVNLLTQKTDITHKGLRRCSASIAKFISVNELAEPDLLNLIKRYCEDLALPKGILLYAERLFQSAPSVMKFTTKSPLIPNYEGRAIAYIIVVLKILFSLDNVTEKEISRIAEKINRLIQEREIETSKLFSFCEWQRYIECRKSILTNLHFPSKIKYDPECVGTSHLYIRFMGHLKSKRDGEPVEITKSKHVLPEELSGAFFQCIDRLNDNLLPMNEMETFLPSLTPSRTYLTQLMENPHYELPNILKQTFYETKVGYMTRPHTFVDLAADCGVKLEVVDHSIQFLEKIVPPFEQPRMPSVNELSELVKLEISPKNKNPINKEQNEYLLDYSHRNRVCKLKVNFENLKHYSLINGRCPELEETLDLEEDSGFDRVLSDGRLDINDNDSDSENENIPNEEKNEDNIWKDNTCLLNKEFCKKYNVKLYNHEIESILNARKPLKEKRSRCRDETGKFIKETARNKRRSNKLLKKKEFKRIINNDESSEEEVVEVPIDCFDSQDSDLSILEDSDTCEITHENLSVNDKEIFFRPYKDYWMYHCIFSRVKGKNFELFEKELPENFLWLLNECANIVEMSTEDLYEEVCLIEAYHLNVLKSKKSKNPKEDLEYEFHNCKTKTYINSIVNKW